jgi:hypothetical protein
MEIALAKKIEELELRELITILTQLMMTNKEAFDDLKEIIDDQL